LCKAARRFQIRSKTIKAATKASVTTEMITASRIEVREKPRKLKTV
jgi:hypothetical protein